jgi:hypothetical protein
MKLDLSLLDRPSGKLHAEVEVPVLDGTDFDAGGFALPPVQDVSGPRQGPAAARSARAGPSRGATRSTRAPRPVVRAARACSAPPNGARTAAAAAAVAAAAAARLTLPPPPPQIDSFEREVVEMVKPNHGTTTLGFIFKHGVIIAVDSRATMGSYICERAAAAAAAAAAGGRDTRGRRRARPGAAGRRVRSGGPLQPATPAPPLMPASLLPPKPSPYARSLPNR